MKNVKKNFLIAGFVASLLFVIFCLVAVPAEKVCAAPSCTDWMKQDNGTYWIECVDDNGNSHCYTATGFNNDGSPQGLTTVTCK